MSYWSILAARKPPGMNLDQHIAKLTEWDRQTGERLIKALGLPDGLRDEAMTAVNTRNLLAHRFLRERAVFFGDLRANVEAARGAGRGRGVGGRRTSRRGRRCSPRVRTSDGLAAARARGCNGGRRRVMTPAKLETARKLYDAGDHTVAQIAGIIGVSRATVHRALAAQGEAEKVSA